MTLPAQAKERAEQLSKAAKCQGSGSLLFQDGQGMDNAIHVHLMGICGAGMGALAGLFHEKGHKVTGADQGAYPPMSDFLHTLGVTVMEGYKAENLEPAPDLVVVGNVIRKDNPEAIALMESGIPYCHMPEAINRFFAAQGDQIVVAGTHGKSTISSMIAWILQDNGLDPGFFIGAAPLNFGKSYQIGSGGYFVIEGDEYDTAFYEKTPKLIHYRPAIGVLTSCEFDHGDIYSSLDEIEERFEQFADMIPGNGALLAFGHDPIVRRIASCHKIAHIYGLDDSCDWWIRCTGETAEGAYFQVFEKKRLIAEGILRQTGSHNLANALAAIVASHMAGIEIMAAVDSISRFKGVKRRQEVLAEINGIMVVDDFAHHPTAVRETISGMKTREPHRRLIAIFEPRTNTSRRAVFQKDYAQALSIADAAFIKEPDRIENLPENERFNSDLLAVELRSRGIEARAFNNVDEMVHYLKNILRPMDIALSMSNGAFGGLNDKLIQALNGGPG
jgi:UDP-N-acetylmuramate: L-alanyl-gamma-D-glutamyl-meso-diaminopimelate ligase